MATRYLNKGETINYINNSSNTIKSGSIVKLGTSRIGIAGADISPNELGNIHVTGVFEMDKKASEAISLGSTVYYTDDGITTTAGSNIPAGWVVAEAKSDDKTVVVKLLG
jgi:hypothetical protein